MTVSLQMQIEVTGKDAASKVFNDVAASAKAAKTNIQGSIGGMAGASLAAVGLQSALSILRQTYSTISSVLKSTVGVYMESEAAMNRLTSAMKMSGGYSASALQNFEEFAKALQAGTRFEDDAAISLMALGKAAGYSNETIKAMTLAAANLAVVTKSDLATAYDALLKSFLGQTRGLKTLLPELEGMSDASIRAGNAINLINEKYRGAAEGEKGLETSLVKLKNAFGDLLETIGKVISSTVGLENVMGQITLFVKKADAAIGAINWKGFISGIKEAATGFLKQTLGISLAIDMISRNLKVIGYVFDMVWAGIQQGILTAIAWMYATLAGFVDGIIGWINDTMGDLIEPLDSPAERWKANAANIGAEATAMGSVVAAAGKKVSEAWDWGFAGKIISSFSNVGAAMEGAGKKGVLAGQKVKEAAKISQDEIKKLESDMESFRKSMEALNKENARFGKSDTEIIKLDFSDRMEEIRLLEQRVKLLGLAVKYQKDFEDARKGTARKKENEMLMAEQKAAEDRLNAMTRTVNAATAGSKATLQDVFNKWGAIGQLIGGIIGFFNRPPTEFVAGIRELFEGIFVDLTNNIYQNIPALVEYIVGKVIPMVIKLFTDMIDKVPQLTGNIITALVHGLSQSLPSVFSASMKFALSSALMGGFAKDAAKAIRDAFKNMFEELFNGKKSSYAEGVGDTSTLTRTTTSYKKISDTQAAKEEFKVREYQASETVTETWNSQIKTATDESSTSLADILRGLWKELGDDIVTAFTTVRDSIWPAMLLLLEDSIKAAFKLSVALLPEPLKKALQDAYDNVMGQMKNDLPLAFLGVPKGMVYAIGDAIAEVFTVDFWKKQAEGFRVMMNSINAFIITSISNVLLGIMGFVAEIAFTSIFGPFNAIIAFFKGGNVSKALTAPGKAVSNAIWTARSDFSGWVNDQLMGPATAGGTGSSTNGTTTRERTVGTNLVGEESSTGTTAISSSKSPSGILSEAMANVDLFGGGSGGTSFFSDMGSQLWNGFFEPAKRLGTWLYAQGSQLWSGFWDKMSAAWDWFKNAGSTIWSGFWEKIVGAWDWFKSAGSSIWSGFWDKLVAAWEWFKNAGSAIWGGVTSAITVAWEWIKSIGGAIWTGFTNSIIAGWEWIKSVGGAIYNGFTKAITVAWEWIKSIGGAIWSGVSSGATTAWKWVGSIGKQIWTGLESAIVSSWNFFRDIGKQIWSGVSPSAGGGSGGTLGRVATGVATAGLSEVYRAIFHNGGLVEPLRFADGGGVPGFGFTDSVPAMLTPGEHVLTQSQASSMRQGQLGGTTVVLNISPGADVSESAIRRYLVPAVIDAIDRQSINGRRFVNQRGIY